MAYEQVETVLKNAATFHQRVSQLYARLSKRTKDERARLLLNTMRDHEQRRAVVLKEFLADVPQKVLLTWLTSSIDSKSILRATHPVLNSEACCEELIQLGIDLDEKLIQLYGELATRGEPEPVRELFESFLEEEQQEERQFAKQALRGLDL